MFLSNRHKLLLFIFLSVSLMQACGDAQTNSNRAFAPVSGKRFPFPTKEPEVYQGDFVVGSTGGDGKGEQQYFVARDGENWRFDIKRDGELWISQIREGGKVYFVDHERRVYSTLPSSQEQEFDGGYFNSLTWGFFRGANYIEYEEAGRADGLVKYKARMLKSSKSDVTVTIDERTGIMVRQEITDKPVGNETPATYFYEVRNLKLETDDSIFDLPSGYTRVASLDYVPRKTKRPGEQ
jgi:outer membrane lipoprotein-sorting protein